MYFFASALYWHMSMHVATSRNILAVAVDLTPIPLEAHVNTATTLDPKALDPAFSSFFSLLDPSLALFSSSATVHYPFVFAGPQAP
jgi:hypothetical protein